MATQTVYGTIASAVTPVTVTLSNFYQSITVQNLGVPLAVGPETQIIWVRADGTAAAPQADGSYPVMPGQTLALNNGLIWWSQVYNVLAKGTISVVPGTPAEIQPYGTSLLGGKANPGVSVSIILDTGTTSTPFLVSSDD
jgi:hypothetical protein